MTSWVGSVWGDQVYWGRPKAGEEPVGPQHVTKVAAQLCGAAGLVTFWGPKADCGHFSGLEA